MTGVPVRNPEDGTDAWLGGITPVRGWSGRARSFLAGAARRERPGPFEHHQWKGEME